MRDYILFPPRLWRSDRFLGLPADDDRFAYLYLRTSPHQTGAGCYALPLAYMAADLRWALERAQKAISALVDASMIEFDDTTNEVRIVDWFETGDLMNPNHYRGVKKRIDQLLSARLRAAAHDAADRAWNEGQARTAARALASGERSQRSMRLLSSLDGGKNSSR